MASGEPARAREPLSPQIPPDRAAVPVTPEELADGLEGVFAQDARLAGARLGRQGLLDCALSRCELAGVDATASSLVRAALTGCRLTGFDASEARLRDVLFRDCRMDVGSLRDARLERVTFERCDLRELDLQGTRLHSVRFLRCDLSDAILDGTDCSLTELFDCSYAGLRGLGSLRGAAVGYTDAIELAPQLAGALGIRVLNG